MKMKWFGPAPHMNPSFDLEEAPAPVGQACAYCTESIRQGEEGVFIWHVGEAGTSGYRPYHRECNVRMLIGGLNHQLGKCTCCGGTEPPDPPGLSKRQAAIAAVTRKGLR